MGTGSLIKSGGLIRASIDIHENFMSNNDVELQPRFNKHSDSLGISGTINSLLIVPIISHTNNASGAFVFANSPSSFREDELHTAIFLTLIPKELMLMEENSKNFN